ncbi:TetR/AcrR family transcriptional regulator [Nakamurella endophytica]|uniref:TetR family transcriptional regulator n=1 Tax=Nakamurella endophytica TaxID=1748367 RepID=A0A917SQG6_9ACTN|nr:TetR/AcrR family transcriptional regulator [Nakamurella endophytica]GGL93708.1 TetR family transcriptional regulator [Nakamurella endophytica]
MPRVSPDHLLARRQQILAGARAAFARHGFEGATVRVLEEQTGLSRGAIFHHFADKDALFLALAAQDAAAMARTVERDGLVTVMREMIASPDPGWLGTQLEVARRSRTDPVFRDALAAGSAQVRQATRDRLHRQRAAGVLRDDVDVEVLASYLELILEGVVAHLAQGRSSDALAPVLDVVETSVRRSQVEVAR